VADPLAFLELINQRIGFAEIHGGVLNNFAFLFGGIHYRVRGRRGKR
jgi:hypothetical protein